MLAKTIVAIFEVYDNAEKAANEIRNNGLRTDNISIISKGNRNKAYYKPNYNKRQIKIISSGLIPHLVSKRERISDGIITGGIFGGVIGIIAGVSSMYISGLGIISAVGPIACLIVGLILGGLIGGLLDLGIPKKRRKEYDNLILNGNTIFSMKVDEERMESIIEIIEQNGALLVEKY